MRTLLMAILLVVSACALPACKVAPYTKGDDAAASMTAATETVARLRAAAEATKASLDPLFAPDAKLKPAYKAFVESVDRYTAAIDSVKRSWCREPLQGSQVLPRCLGTRGTSRKDSERERGLAGLPWRSLGAAAWVALCFRRFSLERSNRAGFR